MVSRSIFADSRTKTISLPSDLTEGEKVSVTIRKISHAGKRRIQKEERDAANDRLLALGTDAASVLAVLQNSDSPSPREPEDATETRRQTRAEREAAAAVAEAEAKAKETKPDRSLDEEEIDPDALDQMLGSMNLLTLLAEGVVGWSIPDMEFTPAVAEQLQDDVVVFIAGEILKFNRRSFLLSGEGR